jgi:hypothetical protein
VQIANSMGSEAVLDVPEGRARAGGSRPPLVSWYGSRTVERPHHFRSHARTHVRYAAQVTSARGLAREMMVVDLSLAGAGLESTEILAVGEHVTVSFQSPSRWDPVVVPAVVTWSRPGTLARIGVSFEHPTPASVYALFETMATLEYGA